MGKRVLDVKENRIGVGIIDMDCNYEIFFRVFFSAKNLFF